MKFDSDSGAKRILKNGFFVAAKFGLYTLSGIIFIPFLVKQYGSDQYGLIALAGFLTQYIGLVSGCVGSAVARFLNIALNKNDWLEANEIFSTALLANIGLVLLQIPLFALGIWKLDWLIDFPLELMYDFRILVGCNVAVFLITLCMGVFQTPIQAANRLDISSKITMAGLAIRLIALVLLILYFGPRLWLIGCVDLMLCLAQSCVTFIMSRKLAPGLRFKWSDATIKWVKPVVSMAAWSVVTMMGSSLFLKTDVWIINRFVSKEMAGIYAALLVWPNLMRQISKQFAALLTPVYMIDYAKGDLKRIATLSLSSSKLLSCFIALGIGFLVVFAGPLLSLWLGPETAQYATLLRYMTLYLVFAIGDAVLWQIYPTMNKVHYSGTVSLLTGILNVGLSIALVRLGYGVIGVAIGTAVSTMLGASLAIPLGVCIQLHIPYRTVFWNHTCAALSLLVSVGASAFAVWIAGDSMLLGMPLALILILGGTILLSKVVLNKEEDKVVKNLLSKIGKRLPLNRTV